MGLGMTCATILFEGVAQGSAGGAKQLAAPLRYPLAPLKGGIRGVARGGAPKPAAARGGATGTLLLPRPTSSPVTGSALASSRLPTWRVVTFHQPNTRYCCAQRPGTQLPEA